MTKQQMDQIVRNSDKTTPKWKTVFSAMGIQNDVVISLLSIYAEYFQVVEIENSFTNSMPSFGYNSPYGNTRDSELASSIRKIISEMKKLSTVRVKVEGSPMYYNILSNKFEYKLENGEYVASQETPGQYSGELNRSHIISAFPQEFVKLLDASEYRDMRINSLMS